MANIVFVMLPALGHLNPTFKLARDLKRRGHRVIYLEIPNYDELLSSSEDYVKSQGFEYCSDLNGLLQGLKHLPAQNLMEQTYTMALDYKEEIGEVMKSLQPELFIIDKVLLWVGLLASELVIPSALLGLMLPIDGFIDVLRSRLSAAELSVLSELPELILCPREFEFPHVKDAPNRHYIGASIDLERREAPFPWERLDRRPLVYCALGSQGRHYPESRDFLQKVVDAFAGRPDLQLVVDFGERLEGDNLRAEAENVMMAPNVPQLGMLQRASMMITHGGLGSVKECIYFGVPMIVFPFAYDQIYNAARVAYHRIGVTANVSKVDVAHLRSLVETIERDLTYRKRVTAMSERLRETENSGRGIELIERIMAGN